MLKPLFKNVILKKEKVEKETKTASGIILTENNKKPSYAIVVAIGPDVETEFKINDKVIYKEYSGSNVVVDDEEYVIVEDKDILAILN